MKNIIAKITNPFLQCTLFLPRFGLSNCHKYQQHHINITDINSGDVQQVFADTNNHTVDSLSPYTTYVCIVAAYTSAGTGPVSVEISVQTQETSEHMKV